MLILNSTLLFAPYWQIQNTLKITFYLHTTFFWLVFYSNEERGMFMVCSWAKRCKKNPSKNTKALPKYVLVWLPPNCLTRFIVFSSIPLIHFYSISRRCGASYVSASLPHSLTTAQRVAKPGKYWQGAPVTRRESQSMPRHPGQRSMTKGRPPAKRERGGEGCRQLIDGEAREIRSKIVQLQGRMNRGWKKVRQGNATDGRTKTH